MKKILLFAHDPGGANTLIPLVNPLRKRGYLVKLFGKAVALERYKKFGLKGNNLDRYIKTTSIDNLKKFLEKEKLDCVITGTSHLDFTEKYLWKASEMLKIPSFAIIDNWMNYAIRFSRYNGREMEKFHKNKSLIYYPSKIFIMDAFSKKQAIKEGMDSSKIVVTGQPYFELIKNIKRKSQKSKNNFTITYASQPLSTLDKQNRNYIYAKGYNEKTILVNIVSALREILSTYRMDKMTALVVKLHPREDPKSYERFVKRNKINGLRIIFDRKSNSIDSILKSDLVLGMTSMFLIEAVILKIPVICIQIGLKGKSDFILAQKGILNPVLTKGALVKQLKNILIKKRIKRYNMNIIKNPAKNIMREVEKYL